jgi:trimeric autotransporter adhesin
VHNFKRSLTAQEKSIYRFFALLLLTLCWFPLATAQESATAPAPVATASTVPALVNFSGTLTDLNGKPLTGVTGVTFLLYKDSEGGAPLWMETQNVYPDKKGQYSVVLGSTTSQGLPSDLFASGEARWLAVQIAGQEEQPRVLLVAVPYALKASDAETVGGFPASAFLRANQGSGNAASASSASSIPNATNPAVTGKGTIGYVPMWDKTSDIINSVLFQKTTNIGVGTATPASKLDVSGNASIRDTLTLFPKSTDPTLAVSGTSFQIGSTGKVNFVSGQTFPGTGTISGVTTASGSGLQGGGMSGALGLSLLQSCTSGQTLAWSGSAWACKTIGGSGGGVTSVGLSAPSSDFTVTGSPVTSSGTLGLNWTVAPTSADTGNAIVKRDAAGSFSSNSITAQSLTSNGGLSVAGTAGINGGADISGGLSVNGQSFFTSGVGIGTSAPQAELNLNYGGYANADTLLIGNNTSRGLQMRDNGNGVDLESIGVPLFVNYLTRQIVEINPFGGQVDIGTSGSPYGSELSVGANLTNGTYRSAEFSNDVYIFGNLYGSATKNLRIDHPLDPTNKYLNHSVIESSEVLNQYSGNVVLDAKGEARVEFPDWFAAINTDFRYQLTAIGAPGPNLYVAEEVQGNAFKIAGGAAGMKVSWQVTARRNDPYMRAHPYVVEQDKPENERGYYTDPSLYGAPKEQGILSRGQITAKKQ